MGETINIESGIFVFYPRIKWFVALNSYRTHGPIWCPNIYIYIYIYTMHIIAIASRIALSSESWTNGKVQPRYIDIWSIHCPSWHLPTKPLRRSTGHYKQPPSPDFHGLLYLQTYILVCSISNILPTVVYIAYIHTVHPCIYIYITRALHDEVEFASRCFGRSGANIFFEMLNYRNADDHNLRNAVSYNFRNAGIYNVQNASNYTFWNAGNYNFRNASNYCWVVARCLLWILSVRDSHYKIFISAASELFVIILTNSSFFGRHQGVPFSAPWGPRIKDWGFHHIGFARFWPPLLILSGPR